MVDVSLLNGLPLLYQVRIADVLQLDHYPVLYVAFAARRVIENKDTGEPIWYWFSDEQTCPLVFQNLFVLVLTGI